MTVRMCRCARYQLLALTKVVPDEEGWLLLVQLPHNEKLPVSVQLLWFLCMMLVCVQVPCLRCPLMSFVYLLAHRRRWCFGLHGFLCALHGFLRTYLMQISCNLFIERTAQRIMVLLSIIMVQHHHVVLDCMGFCVLHGSLRIAWVFVTPT